MLVVLLFGTLPEARAQGTAAVSTSSNVRFECPGCLVEVSPTADRCPECGVSFKKLEYECPKCKEAVPYDASACPKCGLHFDAPAPGTRERRSGQARSMPEPRDFLKKTPPSDERGIEVHGRSITGLRHGRELSFDGTSTITRGYEDLNLSVIRLGIPELSFNVSALLLGDPNLRPQHTVDLKLREAYFRYDSLDATTQAQLGRQFVNVGVAREFVDGLSIHQMLGDRVGFQAFGGHPVATEKQDWEGDWTLGARLYYRGVPKVVSSFTRDLTIGVSVQEEQWDWRPAKEAFGIDFSWSPTWDYDVSGHAYYDRTTSQFYDARFTFTGRPTTFFQFTFDYRYIVPSLLLPKTSIFWVFATDERHEFELDLDFWFTERLKLSTIAKLIHVPNEAERTKLSGTAIDTGDDNPYVLGANISYKHGPGNLCEAGAGANILVKGGIQRYDGATVRMASVLQFRAYEMVQIEVVDRHFFRASADAHLEANDGKVYVKRNVAFTGTMSVGYSYDQRYTFTVGGDYRMTPNFDNTGDVFLKFEVYF